MSPGTALMGRPKKKTGSKLPAGDDRVVIVHLKGSSEFAAWLDAVSHETGIPKATIFRRAVAEWAKAHGHRSPPEF